MSLSRGQGSTGGCTFVEHREFPEIGDAAPDFVLIDTNGQSASLSSYWTKGTTVFAFLRHFGCPFCREQVALLRHDYTKFRDAGIGIVCIGQGPYKAGKAFSILMDIPFPVLVCGDDYSVYVAFGLGKGTISQLMGVNVLLRGFTALKQGLHFGPIEGDNGQMPGVFVVDQTGTVLFAHRNAHQADNISGSSILKVIR